MHEIEWLIIRHTANRQVMGEGWERCKTADSGLWLVSLCTSNYMCYGILWCWFLLKFYPSWHWTGCKFFKKLFLLIYILDEWGEVWNQNQPLDRWLHVKHAPSVKILKHRLCVIWQKSWHFSVLWPFGRTRTASVFEQLQIQSTKLIKNLYIVFATMHVFFLWFFEGGLNW